MTGLAAIPMLLLSRGWHPVWLDTDLAPIVTHQGENGTDVLVAAGIDACRRPYSRTRDDGPDAARTAPEYRQR